MEAFDLFNILINTFCNNIDGSSTNIKKLKKEFRANFLKIFLVGLGFCLIVKAKFKVKEDATSIFQPKSQVLFTALVNMDKELKQLEKLGVIKKNNYSP